MPTSAPSSRRLLWAGFLAITVWGSIAGLLGAVLPALRERAGLSLDGSGGVFVALSCGLVVASLVAGPLLDRLGKKPVLAAASALVCASLLAFEVVNSLGGLMLLAFTMGAGGSALVTGGHALVADLNPEHRAAALNLLDFFFGLGAFVTPFAIVPLQARFGLAAVLAVLAGLAAVVLVYLLATRFPPPAHAREFSMGHAAGLLAQPAFLLPALLVFLYVGTEQSVWDWQVTYFMQHLAIDNVTAARMLSVFPVAIMIGRVLNNRLLMRVSPAPVLVASAAGATVSFVAAMAAPSPALATAALAVAGLFMAAVFPTTLGVISTRFADVSGTALGLAITCGWLGSVAISPSFGFVAHRTDFNTAYLVIVGTAALMLAVATAVTRQRTIRVEPAAGVAGEASVVPQGPAIT